MLRSAAGAAGGWPEWAPCGGEGQACLLPPFPAPEPHLRVWRVRQSLPSEALWVPIPGAASNTCSVCPVLSQGGGYLQEKALKNSCTLYVGNLSFYTTEEQIHELFSKCGDVKRIVMGLDKVKKTPCGFCFVEYPWPALGGRGATTDWLQ